MSSIATHTSQNSDQRIINDLATPFRSFRILALEQAIEHGRSRELLAALRERDLYETDEECRQLLSYAFEAIKERVDQDGGDPPPQLAVPISGGEFERSFESAPVVRKLTLLGTLAPDHASRISDWGWSQFELEIRPPVAARLVKTFGQWWKPDQLQSLTRVFLRERCLTLQVAVLETLARRAPDSLRNDLPSLLETSDPRLRSLAVRALASIAPDEAAQHLEFLFFSEDRSLRMAAVRDCVFLPFSFVKPILLKFLTAESDPDMLRVAGLLLESNPDPEVPFALADIISRSPVEKGRAMKEMFQNICRTICEAGILEEPYDRYTKRLQEFIDRKVLHRKLRSCLGNLETGEEYDFETARTLVSSMRNDPGSLSVLKEALQWRLSDGVKAWLESVIEGSEKGDRPPEPPKVVSFTDLNEKDKGFWLARLLPPDLDSAKPILGGIIGATGQAPDLLRLAIKAATRIGAKGFWDPCFKLSSDADERLAAEALEYLDFEDHDRLLSFLGRYFKPTKPRVRTRALKILGRYDPLQAVSTLLNVLKTAAPQDRQDAFRTFAHFDFFLIRNELTQFLGTDAGREFLDDGLALFQSNPGRENLQLLFGLEKKLEGEQAAKVRRIREQSLSEMLEWKLISPEQAKGIAQELEVLWKKDEDKRRVPAPRVAPPPRRVIRSGPADFSEKGNPRLFFAVALAGIIGFLAILWWGGGRETPSKRVLPATNFDESFAPPGAGFPTESLSPVSSGSAIGLSLEPPANPADHIGTIPFILKTRISQPLSPRFDLPPGTR